jgi:hypothetical protein
MSRLRARGLEIDDPLGPGPPNQQQSPAAPVPRQTPLVHDDDGAKRSNHGRAAAGSAGPHSEQPAGATSRTRTVPEEPGGTGTGNPAWREWGGITGVGSFRLPHELLAELGDTARKLQLPVGLIVTAAITRLLDQPADTIAALVDQADDARIQGRRRARRRLTTRADE